MQMTFFEFAQLALLALIAYCLMHQWVASELAPGERGWYWPTLLVVFLFATIPAGLVIGALWLVFLGVNWIFSALSL